MKDFIQILRRFVPPYKKYLFLNIFFNIFSTVLSLFSFALIIPILEILFKMKEISYNFIPWETTGMDLKDIAINNFYWFITEQINTHSEAWAFNDIRGFFDCHDIRQNMYQLSELILHDTDPFWRSSGYPHIRI